MDDTQLKQDTTYTENAGFLNGGGEMGKLIRALDWSATTLGPVDSWPQSLRTALGIVLHAKFPMFLWWGNDLIQFYNDAYLPSLRSSATYPLALGQKGEDYWGELWSTIKPVVDHILSGNEATWNEDYLVPVERNGKTEDAYWTYSYSPIYDESGNIGGVLAICYETSEKVKKVNDLQLSDQRFQNLVRETTIGIIVLIGKEMRVNIVNEAYGRLVDHTAEELLNQPLFSIIPETEEEFRPILDSVRTTGEPLYLYDHPYFIYVDGEKKEGYLNLVYQPYKEADGTITGVMVLCHEVTAQIADQKSTKESETRFRNLIEESPVATCLFTGRDLIIEIANEAMLDLWGKGASVIGKPLSEALPELKGQPFLQILDDVFTTGKLYSAKDAAADLVVGGVLATYYFDFAYTPLFNTEGEVYGIVDTAIDITSQVLAIKSLEEAEARTRSTAERLQFALDAGNLGSYELSLPDGAINCTALYKQNFGLLPTDTLNYKKLVSMILPADKAQMQQAIDKAIAERAVYIAECRVQWPDNTIHWIRASGNIFYDEQSQPTQIIGVTQDITEQKNFTASLELKNEQLIRINNDLDNFIYTASHDLKAPISNIEGLLHSLLRVLSPESLASERTQRITDMMKQSIERFKKTIGSLTEVVKLQKENSAEAVLVDISLVVEEVQLDLIPMVQSSGAHIVVDVARCPAIRFSEKNLRSVVYNLLSNAIKYRSPDREPQIAISCKTTNEYHVLTVSDNGLGMEPDRVSQLFTMFKRFHAHVEGTGIGLYMVKKMVENAGGRIEVASEVNAGTTFNVYFRK